MPISACLISNQKGFTPLIIILSLAILIIVAGGVYYLRSTAPKPLSTPVTSQFSEGQEVKITGKVLENNLGCTIDVECYLRLLSNGRELSVVYAPPRGMPCLNQQTSQQGIEIKVSDEVEVFGKIANENEIITCDSMNYYIKRLNPVDQDLAVRVTKENVIDSSDDSQYYEFKVEGMNLEILPHIVSAVGDRIQATVSKEGNNITLVEELGDSNLVSSKIDIFKISETIDISTLDNGTYTFLVERRLWEQPTGKLTGQFIEGRWVTEVVLQDIITVGQPEKAKEGFRNVKLYYANEVLDQGRCTIVAPILREIPITNTPIQDTINLLLKGELSSQEKSQGFDTEFPHPEFKLISTNLKDGVLTLRFTEVPGFTSGGSCRLGLLYLQIKKTASQFPEVSDVNIEPTFEP